MKSKNQNKLLEIYGILAVDCICAGISYILALVLRFGSPEKFEHLDSYQAMFLWIFLFLVLYELVVGSGRFFLKRGYWVECKSVIKITACLTMYLVAVMFLVREDHFSRLVYAYFICIYFMLQYASHCLLKWIMRKGALNRIGEVRLLVVTQSNVAHLITNQVKPEAEYRYKVFGVMFWDDGDALEVNGIPVLARGQGIVDEIRKEAVDEVLIYLPDVKKEEVRDLIMNLEIMGVTCHYCLDTVGLNAKNVSIEEVGGMAVATYAINEANEGRLLIKRCIDIIGGLIGLSITGLIYIILAPAIKLDSKGPAIFSQVRIGKNGRRFKIYKFRSMYIDAEERKKELEKQNEMNGLMFKLEDDPRVTKVGKFIRKTSLDEFPQFWNVVKGDMSLVGTRPPTVDEFEQYTPYYRRRLCMTPGLTGMWQVSGRSDIKDFDEVVKLDLHYIDHWSLSLDMKILFQTVAVVLFSRGAK